jgi:hypothetical protein
VSFPCLLNPILGKLNPFCKLTFHFLEYVLILYPNLQMSHPFRFPVDLCMYHLTLCHYDPHISSSLNIHLHLMPRSRMCGVIHLLPQMPSWRGLSCNRSRSVSSDTHTHTHTDCPYTHQVCQPRLCTVDYV